MPAAISLPDHSVAHRLQHRVLAAGPCTRQPPYTGRHGCPAAADRAGQRHAPQERSHLTGHGRTS